MRWRSAAVALLVVVVAAVCVRLGFWQLARLAQKQAMNAALRSALASPPVDVAGTAALTPTLRNRRVRLRGAYDERVQVLLSGRSHDGGPGVHVVTPLVLAGDSVAVLVDRGWLPSPDAATARPQDHPEPGPHVVVGIADTLSRGRGGRAIRTLEADSVTLYSAPWLDADSLAGRIDHPLAGLYLRQLPDSSLGSQPVREAPKPFDETMHLSYAIQWFTFATILVVGSLVLAWTRRGGRGVPAFAPPSPTEGGDHE